MFYSNTGMKTQQLVPNCNTKFTDHLNNPNANSIFIDRLEDNKIVNKLRPKISSGDGIPTKLVKLSLFRIFYPLKYVKNLSLITVT